MTKQPKPMWNDPEQPASVQELLQAGREFQVEDYDFDKGLSTHLGNVAAGAPLPEWASSSGAAAGAGKALLPWLAVPLGAAAVAVGVYLGLGVEEAHKQPTPAPTPATPAARVVLEQVPSPSATPPTPDQDSDLAKPAAERAMAGEARESSPLDSHATPIADEPTRRRQHTGRAKHTTVAHAAKLRAPALAPSTPAVSPSPATQTAPQALQEEPAQTAASEAEQPGQQGSAPEEGNPAPSLHELWSRGAMAQEDPQAQAADDRLEREMHMLSVAQRVLLSDPGRALRLARQGESEFPGSIFTAERQQVLLLALVKLGRLDEARRLAKPYLQKYPKGPFSDRLRRALQTGRVTR